MVGQVVAAVWASPTPVENPWRRRDAALPEGVVHLRKPPQRNPAPTAYAAAIAYIAAALPPAAFQRAVQAASRGAQDRNASEEERIKALAAFHLLVGEWGWHHPD